MNNIIPLPHGEAVIRRKDLGDIVEFPALQDRDREEENFRSVAAHDSCLDTIRQWRTARRDSGLDDWGYHDFFTVNKYCYTCRGTGLIFLGVSPCSTYSSYSQCGDCHGTGDAK